MSRRDTQELAELARDYLYVRRCAGGHLVVDGYVCPRCNSNEPSDYCERERVYRPSVDPEMLDPKKKWKPAP